MTPFTHPYQVLDCYDLNGYHRETQKNCLTYNSCFFRSHISDSDNYRSTTAFPAGWKSRSKIEDFEDVTKEGDGVTWSWYRTLPLHLYNLMHYPGKTLAASRILFWYFLFSLIHTWARLNNNNRHWSRACVSVAS